MPILLALVLLFAAVPPAEPMPGQCFVDGAVPIEGVYTRTLVNASILAGWNLHTSAPVTATMSFWETITRTTTLSTTERLIGYAPLTISPDDSRVTARSAAPFNLFICRAGRSPFVFMPALQGRAIPAPEARSPFERGS